MNKQNIIEAILKEDNLNNVLEAISLLRQGLNEYSDNRFACSVMWTVLKTRRISEKQASVIANECVKEGTSFLWSILDEASCVALGIELPEKPAEAAEEVKAEEASDLYEVEIKRGRSSLYKKANMSAEEAAEVIKTYLAGDKSLKARVKKDGELVDYQPLLVANAKETVAEEEVEETAKETEEGLLKVEDGVKYYAPLMPTETFDLVIKDSEGRIRRDEKDIDWEEMTDWLCTYEYYRKGKYSFRLTYAYDDELLDYRDFLPERAALGLEEVADA